MEKLLNEFVVHRPIDEAWAVLTDVERIAPCMPGAQLEEIEGETYRGTVKVKLGAIATAFKGEAHFVERDDVGHRAVLKGKGRDTTGKGNADALITARMIPVTDTSAKCEIETELHITGKVAQFGRGIMGDVSKKLIAQFATNLNTMLEQSAPAPAATSEPVAVESAAPATDSTKATAAETESPSPAPAATSTAASSGTEEPSVRKISGPAAEPIELSGLAGGAVIKRVLPALGGLVLLLLVLRWFGRR
jgi:hypothetical protein